MNDALSIAQALIRCPSVTPADAGALGVLENLLKAHGFETHRVTFSEAGTPDVDNLYARIGSAAPHITFAGHTDVVPAGDESAWSHGAFSGEVKDGFLYGRGAVDMKGGIACSVAAVLQYLADHGGKAKGSISFLITGDEEAASINGTVKLLKWVAERGEKFDHCVLGEPSNQQMMGDCIKIGRRGSQSGTLYVEGVQGHVAYPHRAVQSGAGYFAADRGAQRRAARPAAARNSSPRTSNSFPSMSATAPSTSFPARRARPSTSATTICTRRPRCASWSRRGSQRPPATASRRGSCGSRRTRTCS